MVRRYKLANNSRACAPISSSSAVLTDTPRTPTALSRPEHHRQISLSVPFLRDQARLRSEEHLLLSPSCSTLRFRRQPLFSSSLTMPRFTSQTGPASELSSPSRQPSSQLLGTTQPLTALKLPPLQMPDPGVKPELPPTLMRDVYGKESSSQLASLGSSGRSASARFHPYLRRDNTADLQMNFSSSPSAESSDSSWISRTPPLSPSRSRTSSLRSTSTYTLNKGYIPSLDYSPSRSRSASKHEDLTFPAHSKSNSPSSVRFQSSSLYASSDDVFFASARVPSSYRHEYSEQNSFCFGLESTPGSTRCQTQSGACQLDARAQRGQTESDYLTHCSRTPTYHSRHEPSDTRSQGRLELPSSGHVRVAAQRPLAVPAYINPVYGRDRSMPLATRGLPPLDELSSDSDDESALRQGQLRRPPLVQDTQGLPDGSPLHVLEDGGTGEIFDSSNTFRTSLHDSSSSHEILCRLRSTTHQCFKVVDGKWACYRRNYLKIDSAFDLIDRHGKKVDSPIIFCRDGERVFQVGCYALQLSSHVVTQNGELQLDPQHEVPLVQFGPARERGPRVAVQPLSVVPGGELATDSTENEQRATLDQTVAAFRRVQIRSATLNNGQRGSSGQQFYALKLTLLAYPDSQPSSLANGTEVCSLVSQPITVRGRSKMHYAPQSKSTKRKEPSGDRKRRASNQQQVHSIGPSQNSVGIPHQRIRPVRSSSGIDTIESRQHLPALPAPYDDDDVRSNLSTRFCNRDIASVMNIQNVL